MAIGRVLALLVSASRRVVPADPVRADQRETIMGRDMKTSLREIITHVAICVGVINLAGLTGFAAEGYASSQTSGQLSQTEQQKDLSKSAPETECDRMAANPDDPMKIASVDGFRWDRKDDIATAVGACRRAVQEYPDEFRLKYQLGRALQAAEEYQESREILAAAGTKGYVAAMHNLAFLHTHDFGGPQDVQLGVSWYEKAAERGYGGSMFLIGEIFYYGYGSIEQDFGKAKVWFERALAHGITNAERMLAEIETVE